MIGTTYMNEPLNSAELILVSIMAENNITLRHSEIKDFGILESDTEEQIKEWANDYLSEIHTEKCVEKNAWRYEV